MNIASLSTAQLTRIIEIKTQIEKLEAELNRIAGGSASVSTGRRGPRMMSAEAREKIAAAQRRRWAKVKGQVAAGKKVRMFSAAGLARIRAAQKARWAKAKAGK